MGLISRGPFVEAPKSIKNPHPLVSTSGKHGFANLVLTKSKSKGMAHRFLQGFQGLGFKGFRAWG